MYEKHGKKHGGIAFNKATETNGMPPKKEDDVNKELIEFLSKLEKVGEALAKVLIEMGLTTYESIIEVPIEKLIDIKGVSEASATIMKDSAKTLLEASDVSGDQGAGQSDTETGEGSETDAGSTAGDSEGVGSEGSDKGEGEPQL
jgi:predicted flap endonuclease-1-like 5' DNA nuclease